MRIYSCLDVTQPGDGPQKMAVRESEKDGRNLPLFSLAHRYLTFRYIAASWPAVWSFLSFPETEWHLFEIVGAAAPSACAPVHMYFDVEFDRASNPGVDGALLQDELLREVNVTTKTAYGVDILREAQIIVLDATTEKKFSRHIVVKMEGGKMFYNNFQVGALLRFTMDRIRRTKERASPLWVRARKGGLDFFADKAVYTAFRVFRCYRSSKLGAGEPRPLLFLGEQRAAAPSYERFTTSLVRYVPPGQTVRAFLFMNERDGGKARSTTRADIAKRPAPLVNFGGARKRPREGAPGLLAVAREMLRALKGVEMYSSSAHLWDEMYGILEVPVLSTACAIRGGDHRSNHVAFRISVYRGRMRPSCLDPDCRERVLQNIEDINRFHAGGEPVAECPRRIAPWEDLPPAWAASLREAANIMPRAAVDVGGIAKWVEKKHAT